MSIIVTIFSLSVGIANALGFVSVAILVEVVIGICLSFLYRLIPSAWFSSRWNRAFGFLPAIIDALILTGFILTAIIGLPVAGSLKQDVLSSRIGGSLVRQTRGLESSLNSVFGGAIQETLHFLTVTPSGKETINLRFKTGDVKIDQSSEEKMLLLVNQERSNAGLSSLLLAPKLREVARAHSRDMLTQGYFSHVNPSGQDPFDRINLAGISFESAGENLAYPPPLIISHYPFLN